VSPEVAVNVSAQTAPTKPARSTKPQADDQFGALVDSNTAAADTQTPEPTPRRSDKASAASDKSARNTSAADQAQDRSTGRSTDTTDASAPADADPAPDAAKGSDKAPDKARGKSDTDGTTSAAKSVDAKGEKADEANSLAEAVQTADQAPLNASLVPPDPTPVAVPVPVTPTDPAAAASHAPGDSPLAIAAAGLAASASTAAQIAPPAQAKTDATGVATNGTAKSESTDTAAAAAAAAGQDAEAAAIGGKPADRQTNPALTATVEQTTPKTSFKAAATAQAKTDVSDLAGGQDATKPAGSGAALTPAQGATANAAAHPQAAKPDADAASDLKANAGDGGPSTVQGGSSAHGHAAGLQAQAAPVDTGAQAASALQAPLSNTTSIAGASTATLTATAATSSAVPLSALPVEIAASARSGKTHFDISLDPAELGRIDVRIAVDRNGQVTSHLTVEKPETLSMLRQDAPQLQRALDDAGLKTGGNGLSFSLRDQSSSGQNSGSGNDNGGNARRLIVSEDDALPAAAVGRGYGRMLGSSSGVDIRV
jgi:flagellar hook-length control protein FliK